MHPAEKTKTKQTQLGCYQVKSTQITNNVTRKSLKTVQHVATDKENLTGRSVIITTKPDIKEDPKTVTTSKDKQLTDKNTQAGGYYKVQVDDLTSTEGPSERYWEVIAERRRVALEETLEENKELHEKIEKLLAENTLLKQMVEESKSLVEVLTEMVGEQEESGIDLAEASTSSLNETGNDITIEVKVVDTKTSKQ